MIALSLVAAAALAATPRAPSVAAPGPSEPRAAILVGAVAPVPGRALLRHAYRDAETMAEVLVSVGGFPPERVHVLRDPDPTALVAAVEREASALAGAPHGMLFFYYSGHAGDGALFTAGKALRVDVLRRALDRAEVSVRIGVVDACEGGDWTRAKGLVPDAPFEVALPPVVESEGSALIASSSGAESAHESDALGGSYFTHHFAAALRGAADERHDGEITLTEAFEYARARTIRETARQAREPQHPSFAVNLKGRQDLVLAQVATSPSTLAVDQREGPLELVHLASGLRIVELPAGPRAVTLAVPPGKYLVRKVTQEGIRAREISVPRDGEAEVAEGELVLVGSERLVVKGARGDRLPSLPGRWEWDLELAGYPDARSETFALSTGEMLTQDGLVRVDARLGITDRLTWKVGTLGFAYGFGRADRWEVVPWGGLVAWTIDLAQDRWRYDEVMTLYGAGVGGRVRFGPAALVLTTAFDKPRGRELEDEPETDSVADAAVGLTLDLRKVVTIHLAAGFRRTAYPAFEYPGWDGSVAHVPAGHLDEWRLGSVQELGFAALPLVAIHLPRGWHLNLYYSQATVRGYTSRDGRIAIAKRSW